MTTNFFYENSQKRIHRKEFNDTFKLNFDNYFSNLLGFDIVTFDEDIHTPDGISTKDFITKTYGEDAVRLIQNLIS
jgi:hypothetical protein